MKFLVLIFCVFFILKGYSQSEIDYAYIDRKALSIPAVQTTNTTDIAAFIKENFDTDAKKVRAIYTWVAANIKYNSDSIHPIIFEEDRDLRNASTLRRRKGVCENYASVFNDICLKSGLLSLIVEGYTRQNNSMDRSPHAWCAVFIDNSWFLYDPTWDEDVAHRGTFTSTINYDYFQTPPEVFIQSHMPFDPMFQLLNNPVTYKEFYNSNTQVNHNRPYFNYADSIAAYQKSNALDKYLAAALRIEKNGVPNSMTATKQKQLQMEIEIIYQDRDTGLYNSAVADYNDALSMYNKFLGYRNNQFTPIKTDSEVNTIFESIAKNIVLANNKIEEINQSKAVLTLNTAPLQKVLNDLSIHAKEQQEFLKNYLSSAKPK